MDLLNKFYETTNPKVKLFNKTFPNAWHLLNELLISIREQNCIYDFEQLYDIFYELVNTDTLTKIYFIDTAKRRIICNHGNCKLIRGGSLDKYRNELYSDLSNAEMQKLYKEPIFNIVTPSNDELFDTFDDMSKKHKTFSSLLSEIGLHNSPMTIPMNLHNNLDTYLAENNLLDKKPSRPILKKMRCDLCPDYSMFMTDRRCNADKNKSIVSFILGYLDKNHKLNPYTFINQLNKALVEHGTRYGFSKKRQLIHPQISKYIKYACGNIRFKTSNGVYKYDEHGVYRLGDMLYGDDYSRFLTDVETKIMFNMSREAALDEYNTTSDMGLLQAFHNINHNPKKIMTHMHKLHDYIDGQMAGLTSITLANVLMYMASKNKNDFSYIIYINKEDANNIDPWKDANKNHIIICVNDYKGTSHWFCMGRYLNDNLYEYFTYCSCNIVKVIFNPFLPLLYNKLSKELSNPNNNNKDFVSRCPITKSQIDGNECGLYVLNIADALYRNNIKKFRRYFIETITKPKLQKDSKVFLNI